MILGDPDAFRRHTSLIQSFGKQGRHFPRGASAQFHRIGTHIRVEGSGRCPTQAAQECIRPITHGGQHQDPAPTDGQPANQVDQGTYRFRTVARGKDQPIGQVIADVHAPGVAPFVRDEAAQAVGVC